MSKQKELMIGGALGTLIGCIAVALYPKRKEIYKTLQEGSKKAKIAIDNIKTIHEPRTSKNGFVTGGILGALSGASAALLLDPKTSKKLRHQIHDAYTEINGKAKGAIKYLKKNAPKAAASVKKASRKAVKTVKAAPVKAKKKAVSVKRKIVKA